MEDETTDAATRPYRARNAWSGALFGVGAIAFIDEAVFHQLLHWHHFYDLATPDIGLVSDGFFHALSWFATIAGLFLLADLRRRRALRWGWWVGGALIGAGAFQLYDGTVHHKLLGIHEIRYVDDVWIYDVVWNILAVVMIAVGVALVVRGRRAAAMGLAGFGSAGAKSAESGSAGSGSAGAGPAGAASAGTRPR